MVALVTMNSGAETYARPHFPDFSKMQGADAGTVADHSTGFFAPGHQASRRLMEEGGKAHHIDMRFASHQRRGTILRKPAFWAGAHHASAGGRVLPIIGQEVIHMRDPRSGTPKADSVLVVGDGLDLHLAGGLVKGPLVGGYDLAGRAVGDLPPARVISVLTFSCWVLGTRPSNGCPAWCGRCAGR